MNGIKTNQPTNGEGAEIDVSKLSIEQTNSPGTLKPLNELVFGRNFTGSHILAICKNPIMTI